jgi:hypothetical protein
MHLAASLFDSWIFLLLVAIAALLKWLASKATPSGSKGDSQEESVPQQERPAPEPPASDEEQIRKFLEALGQPRTAKPPPPLPPRTDLPLRPVAPVRPPRSVIPVPTMQTAKSSGEREKEDIPRRTEQVILPIPPKRSFEPTPATVQPKESPTFEVRNTSDPVPELERTPKISVQPATEPARGIERQQTDIVRLLRTSGGVRQAIILREIFGKPRSLQPFEDLPGTA